MSCFQSLVKAVFSILRDLPLSMSFFVKSFSERSLLRYATTFHIFPTLPTLGHTENSGDFHPISELRVLEEYKVRTCLCLPTLFTVVYPEASSPFWHIREAFDFLWNYLTKLGVYPHSPTKWMSWHVQPFSCFSYLNPSCFSPSTSHQGLSYWCFYMQN